MHLHLGTMGWSYNFWKGKLYPEKLAANEFLAYYAKQFNTVEVDSTFYRIQERKVWRVGKHKLLKISCSR